LLVEPHLEAIDVQHVAAHRMVLLLLDHHRDGLGAVQLEVEQRMSLGEDAAKLPGGYLERTRLAAVPVDHSGHEALPAQAPGGARAEQLARGNREFRSGLAPLS